MPDLGQIIVDRTKNWEYVPSDINLSFIMRTHINISPFTPQCLLIIALFITLRVTSLVII
jgi:hypothetical protein